MLQLAKSERRSVLFLSVDSANRAQVKSNFSMVVSVSYTHLTLPTSDLV